MSNSNNKTKSKKNQYKHLTIDDRRKNNLKLQNGFGSVVYLGPGRRKPYAARITVGWDDNGKQKYKYIGYSETWIGAYQILLDYHNNPYNLDYKHIILDEVFEKVKPLIEQEYITGDLSESSYKRYLSTYKCHLSFLGKREMIELKKNDYQNAINNSNLGHTGRNYIKLLVTKIIVYCNDELGLKLNERLYSDLKVGKKIKSEKHKPFTHEEYLEIEELAPLNDIAKLIMIYLYTGLRPSELLEIAKEKTYLEEDYMVGGLKTENGKNRTIPIPSKVKPYIEYFYNKSKGKYLITLDGEDVNYDMYEGRFSNLMDMFGFDHLPGDTRTSFATKCSDLEIPDPVIKKLMGHSLSKDVTNDAYVKKSVKELLKYLERLEY